MIDLDKVTHQILQKAWDDGIQVIQAQMDPYTPSNCSPSMNTIVINTNWHDKQQLPFTIGHEITHVKECDKEDVIRSFTLGSKSSYEYEANCGSIKILVPYYVDEFDDNLEQMNVLQFMHIFKIPNSLFNECEVAIKKYVNK
ncbi:ImmA/IrrE family metallo-endopeptidase [Fructilactobacillus sp. Tb1]|uniref:ImmA/IrrE family metallo-endopeptidase n=1 Tax=Fructilactobacillus sp. Tb1 TaxID=3422304 RepID=UPI003D2915AE